ncbi:MAG TPA: hypothetical protein PKE51_06700 [Gemmatimonadaceae bacterium]|nr:hypothetical protein [Gemmatimonadaceae bacterium]
MVQSLLRLLALRPFMGMAILGVPILVLIGLGLLVVVTFKVVAALFVPLLVVAAIVWFVRRLRRT